MSSDDCIEKLEQFISDENLHVTYKMLSNECKIHVNKAKEYLSEYLQMKKSKNVHLFAHYFLAGFVEKNGMKAIKILIVPQDTLEEAKKKFKVLTSCHIYSVGANKVEDECSLFSSDIAHTKSIEILSKYSSIKHSNIEVQPPVLNKVPASKVEAKTNFPKKQEAVAHNGNFSSVRQKTNDKKEHSEKNSTSDKNGAETEKIYKDTKEDKANSQEKSHKKGTLASMWQKKEENTNLKKEPAKSEIKGKQGPVKNAGKNNILNMFSRQAEKNIANASKKTPSGDHSSSVKKGESPVVAETKTHEEKNDVIASKKALSADPAFGAKKKESPVKTKVEVNKNTSKTGKGHSKITKRKSRSTGRSSSAKNDDNSEDEFQPKKKKHRRICTFEESDSESENEEANDKAQRNNFVSESPLETTAVLSDDSEEPIPPTPPVIHQKGKAKVWKTVKKTYQDEDGFFVTKTEKELVSVSEESEGEDPLKLKKPENVASKEISTKNFFSNKKQASLTSFFKQK